MANTDRTRAVAVPMKQYRRLDMAKRKYEYRSITVLLRDIIDWYFEELDEIDRDRLDKENKNDRYVL